jgi:hypothetical protein
MGRHQTAQDPAPPVSLLCVFYAPWATTRTTTSTVCYYSAFFFFFVFFFTLRSGIGWKENGAERP